MAISYVGYSGVYVTTTANTVINIGSPSDGTAPQAGDFILVWYTHSSALDTSNDRGGLLSAGYTDQFGNIWQNASSGVNSRLFSKYLTSAETSVIIPGVSSTNDRGHGFAIWYRGVNSFSSFDVIPNYAAGAGTSVVPASVTPINSGSLLVGFASWGAAASTTPNRLWPSPFDWERQASTTSTARSVHARIAYGSWTGGTVSPTLSGGAITSWIGATVALRDASISSGGNVKVWNGSGWVAKPAKIWNGSAWVTKPVKRWNGSAWVRTNY